MSSRPAGRVEDDHGRFGRPLGGVVGGVDTVGDPRSVDAGAAGDEHGAGVDELQAVTDERGDGGVVVQLFTHPGLVASTSGRHGLVAVEYKTVSPSGAGPTPVNATGNWEPRGVREVAKVSPTAGRRWYMTGLVRLAWPVLVKVTV